MLLAGGCGDSDARRAQSPTPSDPVPQQGCTSDGDCPDGFCNRDGSCQLVLESAKFGIACERAPEAPSGKVDVRFHTCAAYLCIDGRCRSCRTDRECFLELGSSQCGTLNDPSRPGKRCGRYDAQSASDAGTEPVVAPPENPEAK